MKQQRRKHSAEFKARVALEAVKGVKTISEIAQEYEIHPIQVSNWKKELLERLPEHPWLKPLMQIHDELVFELPADRLHEAVSFIRSFMEARPFPEMDVPIVAEASYGPDFGHMEEMEP